MPIQLRLLASRDGRLGKEHPITSTLNGSVLFVNEFLEDFEDFHNECSRCVSVQDFCVATTPIVAGNSSQRERPHRFYGLGRVGPQIGDLSQAMASLAGG